MIHYILPVIGAFAMSTICGFIFIPVLLNFCKEKKLYDIPNQRKVHKCLIPRLGGIAFTPSMLLSFLIVTLIMSSEAQGQKLQVSTLTLGLLISLLLLYSVGIVDDLIGLDAKIKFAVQIIAASILPACGLYINNLYGLFGIYEIPFYIGAILTVLLLVFVDNAMNLIDGIDGLSAGLSIIGLTGFLYIFFLTDLTAYCILIAGLVGVLIAYLRFNLFGNPEKNRKIFMGDAGSLTLGFIMGFLFVKSMMHNPHIMPLSSERIVLAYSLLIVPTFDVIRVIIHRIHYKKPIFDADKSHIHHKFMSLGMNQHQALIAILMLQLGYIIFNLLLFHIGCNFTWILCIDIITYTLLHILTIHRIQKAKK